MRSTNKIDGMLSPYKEKEDCGCLEFNFIEFDVNVSLYLRGSLTIAICFHNFFFVMVILNQLIVTMKVFPNEVRFVRLLQGV